MSDDGIQTWDVRDVSLTINGQEIDAFISYEPLDGEDKVAHIKVPKGVVGFEFSGNEPKFTLIVKGTSSSLPLLYSLRDNKTISQINFVTPAFVINTVDAIIASIKPGAVKDTTPDITVSGLAMKHEERPRV